MATDPNTLFDEAKCFSCNSNASLADLLKLALLDRISSAAGGGGTPGGADTQVQFNDAGAFGGDSNFTFNKTTDTLTIPNIGSPAATALQFASAGTNRANFSTAGHLLFNTDNTNDIGAVGATRPRTGYFGTSLISILFDGTRTALGTTTQTSFLAANTTAAAAGAQQVSPALRFTGQGWKTNATAASQAVDYRMFAVPVQGTANPTGRLVFEISVNGAAFTEQLAIHTDGRLLFGTSGGNPTLSPNGATLMVRDQAAGAYACNVGSLSFRCISTGGYGWNSGGDAAGAADTALFRNSAGIVEVNNGTAGTFRDLWARHLRVATAFTVATLPAAGVAGRMAYVTDATAPTFLGALVGGGAVVTPCFDNGVAWVSA